jgi:hypothetical protein
MRDLHRSARVALAAWVMASSAGAANATALLPEPKKASSTSSAQTPIAVPERPQSRRPTYLDCRNGCLYSNGTWMLTPPQAPPAAASAAVGR